MPFSEDFGLIGREQIPAPTDCVSLKPAQSRVLRTGGTKNGAHFNRMQRLQPSSRFALSEFFESGRNQPKVSRYPTHSFIAHHRLPRAGSTAIPDQPARQQWPARSAD